MTTPKLLRVQQTVPRQKVNLGNIVSLGQWLSDSSPATLSHCLFWAEMLG
jgi:hypothetical protein